MMVSGEALPLDLEQAFFKAMPWSALHNLYGPTEAAVDVTAWPCRADSGLRTVPIGKPIANIQIHILDPQRQPVPIGVAGELHIGGVGVGQGYLNRPDLTAAAFIANPFGPGRLYKTGDLCRYWPDGTIEYLGRIDHQVKIRGFRIELGEIETVLGQHPGVLACVVMAREDQPGDKRLVAYVVAQGDGLAAADLKAHLGGSLPEHMVPSAVVLLDAMPLSPNGKADRKALPAPEWTAGAPAYVEPAGPVEQVLALIWADLLQVPQVGRFDRFFDLGGHSLLATQVIGRVRTLLKVELPLRRLFEAPQLAAFAEAVAAADGAADVLDRRAAIVLKVLAMSDSAVQQGLANPGNGGEPEPTSAGRPADRAGGAGRPEGEGHV